MVAPAFGGGRKTSAAPAPTQHEILLSNVGPGSVTISDDKTAKTLVVTQFTEITLNGQKATIADLKSGMIVSVTLGTDPTRASRINATSKK